MREFGELTGIAFQIKDDLFDYGDGGKIGKPTGIDIKEQKMTLPLIYTLNNASKADKKKLINIVKNHNTDRKKVQEVIDFVITSGGIEYTQEKMYEYRKKSLEVLHTFPKTVARDSLEKLVVYTTERNK